MITSRDHDFIVNLDQRGMKDLPDKNPEECTEVFRNLLTHISKDKTIQYILVLIDDILSVSKLKFAFTLFHIKINNSLNCHIHKI